MDKLVEVLRELINASRHTLTPNRVGELHQLVDDLEAGVQDAQTVEKAATDVEADLKAPKGNAGA